MSINSLKTIHPSVLSFVFFDTLNGIVTLTDLRGGFKLVGGNEKGLGLIFTQDGVGSESGKNGMRMDEGC